MKLFIPAITIFSLVRAVVVAADGGTTNSTTVKNKRRMLLSSSQHRRRQQQDFTTEFELQLFSMDDGTNYCLDVQWSSTENFTPLQIWECNGSAAQKFTFDTSTGHLHSQLAADSDDVCVEMDPEYGIFLYSPCVDSWQITELLFGDETVYAVKNIGNDECLVMDNVEPQNGDAVMSGMCLEEDNFLQFGMVWKMVMEEPFKPCC